MSFLRNYRSQGGTMVDDRSSTFSRISYDWRTYMNVGQNDNHDPRPSYLDFSDFSAKVRNNISDTDKYNNLPSGAPSLKRRKYSASMWGDGGRQYLQPSTFEDGGRDYLLHSNSYGNVARYQTQSNTYGDCWRQHVQPKMYRDGGRCLPSSSLYGVFGPSAQHNSLSAPLRSTTEATTSISCKRDRSKLEDEKPVFMSRDEIERCSPSRKDGIDAQHETHLRYSYCAFIQNLGLRLDLPQTTTGTAMVLCHRFFIRRSHACHDRFLIATAALFLAAKSEETPRPLNDVWRTSCEILHKQDMSLLSYVLPIDWFEQYRERVLEAEQMILTTLNFELGVQHPYAPLTSVLDKLGLAQTLLVNVALNLVNCDDLRLVLCETWPSQNKFLLSRNYCA
ncbi:CYCT1-3 [Linum perenne]